jgi:hypothetical protein
MLFIKHHLNLALFCFQLALIPCASLISSQALALPASQKKSSSLDQKFHTRCSRKDFKSIFQSPDLKVIFETNIPLSANTLCEFKTTLEFASPMKFTVTHVQIFFSLALMSALNLHIEAKTLIDASEAFSHPLAPNELQFLPEEGLFALSLTPEGTAVQSRCMNRFQLKNKIRLINVGALDTRGLKIEKIQLRYTEEACLPTEIIDWSDEYGKTQIQSRR